MITTNPERFSHFQWKRPTTAALPAIEPAWPQPGGVDGLISRGDRRHIHLNPARWPEFMNIVTLAEYMDMSVSCVRNLIGSGIIPGPSLVTSTRTKRWRKEEIDEVVARRLEARSKGPSLSDLLHSTDAVPAKRKGR
jgi:predicted DNA-binding transcriptional regulator AlpA